MTFVKRNELPVELRAAYDKAAKGSKNDSTRTNGKNNETLVDSIYEAKVFRAEIEKMKNKVNKFIYRGVLSSVDSFISSYQQIEDAVAFFEYQKARDNSYDKYKRTLKDINIAETIAETKTSQQKFENFKKNSPAKYWGQRVLGWVTLGNADTQYQRLKDKAGYSTSDIDQTEIQIIIVNKEYINKEYDEIMNTYNDILKKTNDEHSALEFLSVYMDRDLCSLLLKNNPELFNKMKDFIQSEVEPNFELFRKDFEAKKQQKLNSLW